MSNNNDLLSGWSGGRHFEAKQIPQSLVDSVFDWMGKDNIVWFKHVKGLKGSINCVLKLNSKRKHIPVHPVHLREGMQIRNFMRGRDECKEWDAHDYDNNWVSVIEGCIKKLNQ